MNLKIVTVIIGCVSFAAGSTAGYLFAKHRLEKKFQEQLKEEIAYTKEFYARMNKADQYETPQKAAQALIPVEVEEAAEAIQRYQGQTTNYHAISKGEEVVRNIFAETSSTDIEREIANRTEEAPYIISVKEYSEGELDYDQATLTYYEGDGVLADEKEEHIPNIDEAVGDNNIPRFGHRSGDPNTLYVRNDALQMDFEIVRKEGKYKELVLGMMD